MVKLTDLQIEILELLKKRRYESQENIKLADGLQFQQIKTEIGGKKDMQLARTLESLQVLCLIEKVGERPYCYYKFNPIAKFETWHIEAICPKCKTPRTYHVESKKLTIEKNLQCSNAGCLRPGGRTRFWAKLNECKILRKNTFTPDKIKFDNTQYKNHREYLEKQMEAKQ